MKGEKLSRKSELLGQVRKHAQLFEKVNEIQKTIVESSSMYTQKNLLYQMIGSTIESSGSLHYNSSLLKPASNADLSNLRTRYLDRCSKQSKVSSFLKTSIEVKNDFRKSLPDYRATLLRLKNKEEIDQIRHSIQVL